MQIGDYCAQIVTHKLKLIQKSKLSKKTVNRCQCGAEMLNSVKCKQCRDKSLRNQQTKIIWPDIKEIEELTERLGFVKASKILGVSDNAIRKRIRKYGASKEI